MLLVEVIVEENNSKFMETRIPGKGFTNGGWI